MPNTLKDYQTNVIVGLGTYTYTCTAAGMHFVSASSTENPPSGLSIVINKNAAPVVTSPALAADQNHTDIQTIMNCAISDVITVVISSSSAIDQQLNTVKTIVNVRQGQ